MKNNTEISIYGMPIPLTGTIENTLREIGYESKWICTILKGDNDIIKIYKVKTQGNELKYLTLTGMNYVLHETHIDAIESIFNPERSN